MQVEEVYLTLSAFHQIYKTQKKLWYKSIFYTFVHQMLRKIRSSDKADNKDYSNRLWQYVDWNIGAIV
jgi:hypothetical protein